MTKSRATEMIGRLCSIAPALWFGSLVLLLALIIATDAPAWMLPVWIAVTLTPVVRCQKRTTEPTDKSSGQESRPDPNTGESQ